MTREEILAMKPGIELNWLVCEKVFDNKTFGSVWPYSTDVGAAWLVLKKLREEFWCIEIHIADGCWVIMELLRCLPIRVEINGGTPFGKLPEAICKAALLAKLEVGR